MSHSITDPTYKGIVYFGTVDGAMHTILGQLYSTSRTAGLEYSTSLHYCTHDGLKQLNAACNGSTTQDCICSISFIVH